jgi:glycosyltransferase involved in cell wall biosynthesis
VFVTGAVQEVADYLRSASAVVVPIRFGGGTRIKILEALAHGKAVVSTTVGAEGIEVESGKHLLLADSPEDLAKACALLLKDSGLRSRLGEQGFCLVQDRYQWKSIERTVEEIVLRFRRSA